jgi:hypothetical protein
MADANTNNPRYEITRVSEFLQARLRAPRAQHPVNAQAAQTRLGTTIGANALTPAIHEYSRMFDQDGMSLTLSGLLGGNDTSEEELLFSWAEGPFSAAITQFHFETDGFRKEHYQNQDYWNILAQYRLAPSTSIQLDYRNLDFEHGELAWHFDPTDYFDDAITEDKESLSVGGHHVFSPNWDAIAFLRHEDFDGTIDPSDSSFLRSLDERGKQGEVQAIGDYGVVNLVLGGGSFERDRTEIQAFTLGGKWAYDLPTDHRNAYAYITFDTSRIEPAENGKTKLGKAKITFGVSREDYEGKLGFDVFNPVGTKVFSATSKLQRKRTLPKVGLTWNIPSNKSLKTTIRAAYFETLKRALIGNETLEPTTIAGFNQFYEDPEATVARSIAMGIDVSYGASKVFAGINHVQRDLDFAAIPLLPPLTIQTADAKEATTTAYANWLASDRWGFGLQYQRQYFDRSLAARSFERIVDAKTDRLAVHLERVIPKHGLSFRIEPTWIHQRGTFANRFEVPYRGSDDFIIVNAEARYKLPKRRGTVAISVENLFDESFNYQDEVPFKSRYSPELNVSVRATLLF